MEVRGKTVSEAWETSIPLLLSEGSSVPTERSVAALELCNLVLVITTPAAEPRVSPRYGYGEDFLNEYVRSYGEDFPELSVARRIHGTRGEEVDQVDLVRKKLEENWFSRRAVVSLWRPVVDSPSHHPPCLVGMQFLIRREALDLTVWLRSNDAWLAALPDMLAMTTIQESVASKLRLACGIYTHFATSYHIYESDIAVAMEAFGDLAR